MLSDPVAAVSHALGMASKLHALTQSVRGFCRPFRMGDWSTTLSVNRSVSVMKLLFSFTTCTNGLL